MPDEYRDYGFANEGARGSSPYLWPPLLELMPPIHPGMRILDVGCGNGYFAGRLLQQGCQVVGIDLSASGIQIARQSHPQGRFELLTADEQVLKNLNEEPFDCVISTEVIEHLYAPRPFVRGCFAALKPEGRFVCSTPYHGYLKVLAIVVPGHFDAHFYPLWDGGHIKFWSRKTLLQLFHETGFVNLQFRGAGRCPYLWKSMLVAGDRPAAP